MFGYSVRSVQLSKRELDPLPEIREHATCRGNPPRAVSLGVHCLQGVLCVPQGNGMLNQECGLGYRLCRKMPPINKRVMREFRGYVPYLLQRILPETIPPDCDFTPETWLTKTYYPLWRCVDLLRVVPDIPLILSREFFKRYGMCKAFVKLENYSNGTLFEWGTYKPPRIISSRTDHVKVAVGPIIKAIEERVYKLPYFVKHIPVPDRPAFIKTHVETLACRYMSSDYTSFECGFTPQFMAACEFALYKHCLRRCPAQLESIREFQHQCCGTNRVRLSEVTGYMRARRQSGEMTTSLGNGFSNLAMTAFLLRNVIDVGDLRGVVEGDDGLFAIPQQYAHLVAPEKYNDFGFLLRSSWSNTVNEASFCGLVYDVDDQINLTNPIDEILSIGWSMGQNIHASENRLTDLLVAKTYSLAYEYSGCPVVYKLARWLARARGLAFNVSLLQGREWSNWEREQYGRMLEDERNIQTMLAREPTIRSRLLMEKIYGITVTDQLSFEDYFDKQVGIHPIDLPGLCHYISPMASSNLSRVVCFAPGSEWEMIDNFIPD